LRYWVCVLVLGLIAAPGLGLAREGGTPAEPSTAPGAFESQSDAAKATDPERAPDEEPADEGTDSSVESHPADRGEIPDLPSGLGIPRLVLRGFGDVGYQARWIDPVDGSDESDNHFAIGSMDLFITSRLGGGFSFLSETVFGFDGSEGEISVERLLLMYERWEWLKLNMGRGHTALGYWNQAFHHGKWLQTTIERPLVYRFEDHGGILPIHFVGLELFGSVDFARGLLSYAATVANGRGKEADKVQITEDFNPAKAFGLLLRYRPNALQGFGIGASGYFDEIPENAEVAARALPMREYVYSGHVFYVEGAWELMVEGSWILHDDDVLQERHRSSGAYAQAAYRFGRLKPYYRFDWLSIARNDPYYVGLAPIAEDTRQHTVGLRWDPVSFVAFKLEYVRRDADSEDVDAMALQASFAF